MTGSTIVIIAVLAFLIGCLMENSHKNKRANLIDWLSNQLHKSPIIYNP